MSGLINITSLRELLMDMNMMDERERKMFFEHFLKMNMSKEQMEVFQQFITPSKTTLQDEYEDIYCSFKYCKYHFL